MKASIDNQGAADVGICSVLYHLVAVERMPEAMRVVAEAVAVLGTLFLEFVIVDARHEREGEISSTTQVEHGPLHAQLHVQMDSFYELFPVVTGEEQAVSTGTGLRALDLHDSAGRREEKGILVHECNQGVRVGGAFIDSVFGLVEDFILGKLDALGL